MNKKEEQPKEIDIKKEDLNPPIEENLYQIII